MLEVLIAGPALARAKLLARGVLARHRLEDAEGGAISTEETGAVLLMPYLLTLKAEALYLADRTSEALAAIKEAEILAERFEQGIWCGELHRLRGAFVAAVGTDEAQIEASFCEAIKSQESRSRFRWRNAQRQPTQNIATKKRAGWEGVDSDYLFGNFLWLPTFRSSVSVGAPQG